MSVEAADLGTLPAAVEVAAYRIAGEALTNVTRHAAAPRRAVVRLLRDDRDLLVEVADDGSGIAPEAQAGVGLVSLRERAAELGGRSEVTCPPTRRDRRPGLAPAGPPHRRELLMSSPEIIRVVVVDDHQIVRDGLVALLGALDGRRGGRHGSGREGRGARRHRDLARTS